MAYKQLPSLKEPGAFSPRDNIQKAGVVVLGAGIAGLTAAHELVQQGHSVTVLDQQPRCGGSHIAENINGYTFDIGSFFFNREHPMFTMFPETEELFLEADCRKLRLAPDGRLRRYPFEPREVLDWPFWWQLRAAASLAYNRLFDRNPINTEQSCIARLGRVMYVRSGLATYIERLHGFRPNEISNLFFLRRMNFVTRRSGWTSLARLGLRVFTGKSMRVGTPPTFLIRPKEGFDPVYERIRENLSRRGVNFHLGESLEHVEAAPGQFRVSTRSSTFESSHLICAMPIATLHDLLFREPSNLVSCDLLTLYVSASGDNHTDATVLFNFNPRGKWKRLTVYSKLYGKNEDGRSYFAVEFPQRKGEVIDPEEAFEGFVRHVTDYGVFEGPIRL